MLLVIGSGSYIAAKAQAADVNDSLALVDLYNSTNGPEWYSHENWLTTAPLQTWAGVTVTNARVTSIYLPYKNLNGSLHSSIGNLTQLQDLELRYDQLRGAIPLSIGKLKQLRGLYLNYNQLSGEIPHSVHKLSKLRNVDISNNQLTQSSNVDFPMADQLFSMN